MASPTYAARVVKKVSTAVELEIKSLQDEAIGLWPSLVVRVLEDPPGSPLAGRPLYDAAALQASIDEQIGEIELLKRKKGVATLRVHFKDAAFAAHLAKGSAWESYHYATDEIRFVDAVFLPGGELVMVGDSAGAVEIVPVTKKGPGPAKVWMSHAGLVALGAAGDTLITAGGRSVRVWSPTGERRASIEPGEPVTSAAISGDGATIVVGTATGEVTSWSSAGAKRGVVVAAGSAVTALAFAGADVVVGHEDGAVRRHGSGGVIEETRHAGAVLRIATSPAGDVASVGADREVRWSRGGAPVRSFHHTQHQTHLLAGAKLSADGKRLVNTHSQGLEIIDAATGAFTAFDGAWSRYVSINDAADRILTHAEDQVRVYAPDGKLLRKKKVPAMCVGGSISGGCARLSPDGRWFTVPFYAAGGTPHLELHAVDDGTVVVRENPLGGFPPHPQSFSTMAAGAPGLLVGYAMGNAILWSYEGEKLAELEGPIHRAQPAGSGFIVSRDHGKTFTRLDRDLRPGRSVEGPPPPNDLDEGSRDGRFQLIRSNTRHLVWDTETGETWDVPGIDGVTQATRPTLGRSDDRLFVIPPERHADPTIHVHDLHTRKALFTIPRTAAAYGVTTAPDGSFWIAGLDALHHHDAEGRLLRTIEAPPPSDVPVALASVFFDRDGNVVTTAAPETNELTIRVWPASGAPKEKRVAWGGGILAVSPTSGLALGLGRHTPQLVRI